VLSQWGAAAGVLGWGGLGWGHFPGLEAEPSVVDSRKEVTSGMTWGVSKLRIS
jgi:hypothetical protein